MKQEIKAITEGLKDDDEEGLDQYGGFNATEGVSIDDYSTWRAVRFAERDEIG